MFAHHASRHLAARGAVTSTCWEKTKSRAPRKSPFGEEDDFACSVFGTKFCPNSRGVSRVQCSQKRPREKKENRRLADSPRNFLMCGRWRPGKSAFSHFGTISQNEFQIRNVV